MSSKKVILPLEKDSIFIHEIYYWDLINNKVIFTAKSKDENIALILLVEQEICSDKKSQQFLRFADLKSILSTEKRYRSSILNSGQLISYMKIHINPETIRMFTSQKEALRWLIENS